MRHTTTIRLLAVLAVLVGYRNAHAQVEFGTPVHLGTRVNTSNAEFGSTVSCDGLSLFFQICKFQPLGCDLFVATRESTAEAFGVPVTLGPELNTRSFEVYPTVSPDGLELYFADQLVPEFPAGPPRSGGLGGGDLWVARRDNTSEPFGRPENLGSTVNSPQLDGYPKLSRDGLELYFASSRPSGEGGPDLWVARRASKDDEFGPPENLGPSVNSRFSEGSQDVSADGLVIIFASNRSGGRGDWDLWMATRESTDDDFGPAVNLGPRVNTGGLESGPNLSADASMLFFESIRPGGRGLADLYQVRVFYEQLTPECGEPIQPRFQRGDANIDGSVDITDGVFILSFLFLSGTDPQCLDAADSDDSGVVDLADAVRLFGFLFSGSAAPSAPAPGECGVDSTDDNLSCDAYGSCE